MRKTISVQTIRESVNNALRQPGNHPEMRRGMIMVLNHVLHESGNYFGFRYLTQDEVPGDIPGIWLDDAGDPLEGDARFANTDDTRVHYF